MNQCFFYDCDLRNNAGYCKVTACINPKYCSVTNTVDGYISARYKPPIKKTNADRIRAMTDEELVFFLWWFADGSGKTKDQWRDWLKQERDNGT